jgi:hypothetical protein
MCTCMLCRMRASRTSRRYLKLDRAAVEHELDYVDARRAVQVTARCGLATPLERSSSRARQSSCATVRLAFENSRTFSNLDYELKSSELSTQLPHEGTTRGLLPTHALLCITAVPGNRDRSANWIHSPQSPQRVTSSKGDPPRSAQSYSAPKPPIRRFATALLEFEKIPSNNGKTIRAHPRQSERRLEAAFRHIPLVR